MTCKGMIAFVKAWEDTCGDSGEKGTPTLAVPGGKKFRLSPVAFKGPCKSSSINVQIDGTLVAPSSLSGWKGCSSGKWLNFQDVANLNVKGSGQVDGQGSPWWDGAEGPDGCENRPTALAFSQCVNLVLSGLKHVNSPRNHISISGCDNGIVSNLQITAPESSPNTDGIDISHTNNLDIHDLDIQTGDDCIAINGGSSNISITRVSCGPGHGVSIGSLGKNGAYETVEQVQVRDCSFSGTTNGVRIKTWQASGVVVSDVTFTGFRGSSASDQAIKLSCSSVGCSDITLDNVQITSSKPGDTVTASCENAHGSATLTTPPVRCLGS
ncbi:probable polygalacturonase At3g15720 [Eucalyptus grandis]|uniref:probable polygalacturonase At3g15720 n=1 Tax=Eucalyptus grandis TaxID=71139 RepID=UPI00192E845C|nr:probable polygalacturonase At3g15720 [Eucalyptus grandis]